MSMTYTAVVIQKIEDNKIINVLETGCMEDTCFFEYNELDKLGINVKKLMNSISYKEFCDYVNPNLTEEEFNEIEDKYEGLKDNETEYSFVYLIDNTKESLEDNYGNKLFVTKYDFY